MNGIAAEGGANAAQCELGQAVLEIAQKALRLTPVLEAHNGVVGVSHDDHVAGRTPFAPLLHPEIQKWLKAGVLGRGPVDPDNGGYPAGGSGITTAGQRVP